MSSRFEHHFEGAELLDGLLDLAGSPFDSNEVLARFVAGHQAGASPSEVIPTLFDGEPRFPSPDVARRLYQNLFGLWDLVTSGRKVELEPTKRPPREKNEKPTPPSPWDAAQGPDKAFVEAAWRYLDALPEDDPRAQERLVHAFENRQDALIQWLDEQDLPDAPYAALRYLLFELHAMLELGSPHGVGTVDARALRRRADEAGGDGAQVPQALRAWVDESLAEGDLEDEPKWKALALLGLHALWAARRDGPAGRA